MGFVRYREYRGDYRSALFGRLDLYGLGEDLADYEPGTIWEDILYTNIAGSYHDALSDISDRMDTAKLRYEASFLVCCCGCVLLVAGIVQFGLRSRKATSYRSYIVKRTASDVQVEQMDRALEELQSQGPPAIEVVDNQNVTAAHANPSALGTGASVRSARVPVSAVTDAKTRYASGSVPRSVGAAKAGASRPTSATFASSKAQYAGSPAPRSASVTSARMGKSATAISAGSRTQSTRSSDAKAATAASSAASKQSAIAASGSRARHTGDSPARASGQSQSGSRR